MPVAETTMTYRLTPAGHGSQPKERRHKTRSNPLADKLGEFLNAVRRGDFNDYNGNISEEKAYRTALRMTKGFSFNPEETGGLLIPYIDNPIFKESGLFLSALYAQCLPEEVRTIIYDLSVPEGVKPMDWLGHRLPEGKILFAAGNATVGNIMGTGAKAPVIAAGKANVGGWMGQDAEALVIAAGNATVGDLMGHCAKAPVIATGNATVGFSIGRVADAPVIATGKSTVGNRMGYDAKAPVIAAGNANVGNCMGSDAEGPVIATENATVGVNMGGFDKCPVIGKETRAQIPALERYLEKFGRELVSAGTNPEALGDLFRRYTPDGMKASIEGLLRNSRIPELEGYYDGR